MKDLVIIAIETSEAESCAMLRRGDDHSGLGYRDPLKLHRQVYTILSCEAVVEVDELVNYANSCSRFRCKIFRKHTNH